MQGACCPRCASLEDAYNCTASTYGQTDYLQQSSMQLMHSMRLGWLVQKGEGKTNQRCTISQDEQKTFMPIYRQIQAHKLFLATSSTMTLRLF